MKKISKSLSLCYLAALPFLSKRAIKTAVCNRDQLLDFSVPELVQSQSTFSTDLEVLQNCAGFTLCSSEGLAVGECSAVMGFDTMHVVYRDLMCVTCIGLSSAEFLTYEYRIRQVGLCFGNLCVC